MEVNDDARLQQMAFRSNPGFTSSPLRMTMFGITTLMFSLGIVTLVLETMNKFRTFDNSISPIIYNAWATTTCLMVRLRDAFMPSA